LPASERPRYLALPSDLPERIRTLSTDWTRGLATPLEKAKSIERHLRTEFRYDLGSPSGKSKQPLDDFLFESKRGHCEFYSTAMAVMLRTLDVPTRNVTGFIGGSYNRFGRFYAVRQGDAHSWVEVFLDDQGWVTFDPTPPGDAAPKSELGGAWAYVRDFLEATSQRWDRHVVGYDLNQQVSLFQTLTRNRNGSMLPSGFKRPKHLAPIIVGGVLVAAGVYVYLRRRGRKRLLATKPGEARSASALLATELYELLDGAMSAQGVPRSPGLPPLRHAEALATLDHPLSEEIMALTEIYLRARFGGEVLSDEIHRDFEARVKILRATPRTPAQAIAA
ncbi:MAG: transglutaminase domain-containing protein, partial [Minicystis sp.]